MCARGGCLSQDVYLILLGRGSGCGKVYLKSCLFNDKYEEFHPSVSLSQMAKLDSISSCLARGNKHWSTHHFAFTSKDHQMGHYIWIHKRSSTQTKVIHEQKILHSNSLNSCWCHWAIELNHQPCSIITWNGKSSHKKHPSPGPRPSMGSPSSSKNWEFPTELNLLKTEPTMCTWFV